MALIIFICSIPSVFADEGNQSIANATTNATSLNETVTESPAETILVNSTVPVPADIMPDQMILTPVTTLISPSPDQTTDIVPVQPVKTDSLITNRNISDQAGLSFAIKDSTFGFTTDEAKKIGLDQVLTADKTLRVPRTVKKYKLVTFNHPRINTNLRSALPSLSIQINGVDYLTDLKRMDFDTIDDGIDSYSGTLVGQKNSSVLLTINDNATIGSITLDDETYYIEPVLSRAHAEKTNKPLHIIYSSKDVEGREFLIDNGPVKAIDNMPVTLSQSRTTDSIIESVQPMAAVADGRTAVTVLVVTDNEFYSLNSGPDWKLVGQDIIAEANRQFGRDDIKVILVPTFDDSRRQALSSHPLKNVRPLDAFSAVYDITSLNSYSADLGLYLGGNNIPPPNPGWEAQGLSDGYPSGRYSWAQMIADDDPLYLGTIKGRRCISIHEIGHQFGADHEDNDEEPLYNKAYEYGFIPYNYRTVMWSTYSETVNTYEFSSKSYHGDDDHNNALRIYITKVNVANKASCSLSLPSADFTWAPDSPPIGQLITFTITNPDPTNYYYWIFDDGSYSSELSPRRSYGEMGTHTVRLTVANCAGSSITEHNIIITSPTQSVFFSGAPQNGPVPLNVQFTDSSIPTPTSWVWDFGDGNASNLRNPQHTYSGVGSYSVNLTVIQNGLPNSTSRYNYITVESLVPEASFGANVTYGKPPLAVAFSDLSSKSPTNWSWNFGDGGTSNIQNPVHTYSSEGNYDVSLTASNAYGPSSPTTAVNYITVTNVPLANGSYWSLVTPDAQWPGKSYFASTVYNNKIWVMGGLTTKNDTWSSPDGITWTQVTPAALWPGRNRLSALTFKNKMWVLGGNTNGPANNDVWYSANGNAWTQVPAASWPARYDQTALVHNNRIWVMGGQDNTAAKNDVWSSADGVSWTVATMNAPWTARIGSSSVSFNGRIWILGGLSWTGTRFNDVWYSTDGTNWTLATANAAWSPRYNPQAVVYDNKIWLMGGQDNLSAKNDVWYSIDGTTWTQATGNASWAARYPQALVFNNTMWIVGGSGFNDVWRAGVYYPIANFTANNTYGSAPLAIAFTDTSNNAPASWFWNFGDNQNSTQRNPVHSYASAGTYNVSLKVTNEAGNNTMVQSNYITVTSQPLPNGSYWALATSNASWPGKSNFAATVYDNKMWVMGGLTEKKDVWSSQNGITWTQATPAAPWAGRNRLSAVTFNNKMWVLGGNINGPAKNDTWYSTDGNGWTKATETAKWPARYDQTALVYNNRIWVMGGQDNSAAYNDVWSSTDGVSWTPVNSGAPWAARIGAASVVFNGKIWILGGQNWAGSRLNDVWNSTDGATWTLATGNAAWSPRYQPQAVVYDNKIWILGGRDGSKYKNDVWYSSDGITWTQAAINANWASRSPQALVFNNTMWILGGNGYNDVWYASNRPASVPIVTFTGTPRYGTTPMTVTFTGTSTGSPTSWLWDFGDGDITNATKQNPVHRYNSDGLFTVQLTVTNATTGSNATVKQNYILTSPVTQTTQTDGVYTVVSFTHAGSTYWTAPAGVTSVQYLVVGGGGGGGGMGGGGGGGGGVLSGSLAVTPGTAYPLVVGAGGAGNSGMVSNGVKGGNSSFGSTVIVLGGGGGGSWALDGSNGGSGGGGGGNSAGVVENGGSGTSGQGYSGGSNGGRPSLYPAGGGGGAGAAGGTPTTNTQGGNGGAGRASSITGTTKYYAGGGGGATNSNGGTASVGGSGGGGAGASGISPTAVSGTADTGGGGGGAAGGAGYPVGNGGSGIVIIRYPTPGLAPVTSFTGSPLSGTVPLTVIFTDTSQGSLGSWKWTFGDNNSTNSSQRNPVHTYLSTGVYTVSLNVTNAYGSNVSVKANYITVTPPPVGNDATTVILMHYDTTNPALDSALGANLTFTNPLGATRNSTNPKFGPGSVYLYNKYLRTSGGAPALNFGTGNFTIDFWIKPLRNQGTNTAIFGWYRSSYGGMVMDFTTPTNTPRVKWDDAGTTRTITSNTAIPLNTWTHVAVVGEPGGVVKLYQNGSMTAKSTAGHNIRNITLYYFDIGDEGGIAPYNYLSYANLDEFRLMKGTAYWTGNFTPPAAAYG